MTFQNDSRAYIYNWPGHWLSRLGKGTPPGSRITAFLNSLGQNDFLDAAQTTIEWKAKRRYNAHLRMWQLPR